MVTDISFADILTNVEDSDGHRYGLRDSLGNNMDTLKVIGDPTQGYLGVYHTGDDVKLATSSDLLTWTFRRTLDPQATQPSIRALPTGGFLTATEYNNQVDSGGRLRVRHYPDLSALFTGAFSHDVTIQRTLSGCNEGTPTISVVALEPDIERSVIDLDFHYQRRCDVDRQANGRLTNFTSWTATADPDLDRAITAAAAAQGIRVRGNIGDRDTVVFDDVRYSVHEVQYRKNDFGSWRIYLRDWQRGSIAYLPITTHHGSTAFANPSVTTVIAPSGRTAVVAGLFLPSEGAAAGEGGQLLYYREYSTGEPNPAGRDGAAVSNDAGAA
jgi:hypothetical protein